MDAIDAFPPATPVGAGTGRRRGGAGYAPPAVPVAARPASSRPGDDRASLRDAPVRAARSSAPAPGVPRQTTPAGTASPAYGDWTKPSRAELAEMAAADQADYMSAPIRGLRPAPATTAIPERSVGGRRGSVDDRDLEVAAYDSDDLDVDDAPVPARSSGGPARRPADGPVTGGGRAARRAELQAADLARKEAAKRNGTPIVSPLDEENPPRRSRVLVGLVAMVVVALGVLGVYQVVSPDTDVAASRASAATTSAPELPDAAALPTLPTTPAVAEPTVSPDVKAPVTVLNATQTTGLAARIAAAVAAGGWETPAVGPYGGTDVAASTVFFTEGDETQRQAAVNLVNAFPQLAGPAPRFFDVPADVAAPGLVVVTTGDWQP